MKRKLVLLASGDGTLAQAIMDAVARGEIDATIAEVISDQPSANVLNRASLAGVKSFALPMMKDRSDWNSTLARHIEQLAPDLVVSVGFMRILSPVFISKFKIINTHPSVLPAFPGAHAVRDAIAAGATTTGATVHWIDEGVDTGRIISQVTDIEISPGESEESLHERIKIVERIQIIKTLKKLLPTLEQFHV